MRRDFDILLKILRGDWGDLSPEGAALDRLLELAEHEHVLPSVVRRYLIQGSITPTAYARLKAVEREAAIAAFYWSAELTRLLQAFSRSDLMVVLLKGPFLAERLYGDVALRASYDLDILVAKDELTRAEAILSELGFRPGAPDDYHRQWYRGPTTVELHHDVENPLAFDFDTRGALSRAAPAVFQGQPCWKFAAEDELLYLCLHGVRHRFERLSLVLDLCHAFRKLPPPTFSGNMLHNQEQKSLLLLGLAMARHLEPTLEPLAPVPSSSARKKHQDAIADRLWDQLLTQSSETLDWHTLHAFYVEMELPRDRIRRRMRHLRILVDRLIAPDYDFAARFGLRRTWQVRLLRPVRLAFEAPRRSIRLRAAARG